jgi:putative membrane protein
MPADATSELARENRGENDAATWQRLSTWSVLHFIARFLRQLFSNLLAFIPAVYGLTRIDNPLIIIAIVVMLTSAVVLYAVLQHLNFSYQLTDDSILVRQGVLFKKQVNLTFHRIQNVSFEHPFYFRPIHLVTVKVDGAGSSNDEVYLSALRQQQAEFIHDTIKAGKDRTQDMQTDTVTAPPVADEAERFLIGRDLPDLILHGLTNNRAWIILGGFGAIFGQFEEPIGEYFAELGFDPGAFIENQTFGIILMIFVSAFFLSVLIVAVLSVLGAIVTYFDFELYSTDDSLTVQRGLFTRHEIHMKKSRIQNVYFRQDWLDRVLGRVNLIFEQLSHGANNPGTGDNKLLVPTVTVSQAESLTNEAVRLPAIATLDFTPVAKRLFFRNALICTAVILAATSMLWFTPLSHVSVFLPLLLVPIVGLVYLSWKSKGIVINDDIAVIRRGIIGIDYIVIQLYKLQKAQFIQTPSMRHHNLATIQLTVASRSSKVPYLNADMARQIVDYAILQAERSQRSWM